MASRSPLTLLLLCCLLGRLSVLALQVTPNSPCASTCLDSTTLDESDPNSSNTRNADITCKDAQFGSSTAGIKWQNCLSCLQNSTFSQGSENDQMWFLYNMRYSLSYCIFGFPNATNAQTSPCLTSFACEPLTNALEDGILSPQSSTQYGYCSVDNGAATHQAINHCSGCISAGGETQYLANYLTALDAGCAQKPAPGHILGLNGSVFSPTAISIVDPALITPTATPNSGSGLPSTIIAAIVVVVVVVLLIAAAFVFIRIKKRQNRRKRASYETKFNAWGGSGGQMPQSPLSFQCQTHIGPASPNFFPAGDDHEDHTSGLGRKPSLWKPHNAGSSFQNISAVTESPPRKQAARNSIATAPHHQNPLQYHPAHHPVPLHSLNTTTLPSYPSATHASPMSGSQARFSPDSYTPTSAASTRSTAPLLPAYVPAQHASNPPLRGPHNINITSSPNSSFSPVATTTNNNASPLLRGVPTFGQREQQPPPPTPPPKSPRMTTTVGVTIPGVEGVVRFNRPLVAVPGGRKKSRDNNSNRESGSPVESRTVASVFPPPPPPRR